MKVKIEFTNISVIRHGDPKRETYGEIYYSFKVNEYNLISLRRNSAIKAKDNSTIKVNKSRTVTINETENIVLTGFVADSDKGLNGKDERDDFRVLLTPASNWNKGTNQIHLLDGNLQVTVHYDVTLIGFPNPKPDENIIKPNKIASVVIVSMIDSNFRKIFQNAHNNYGACLTGYDRTVLFKKQFAGSPKPTEHNRKITKEEILEKLKSLADSGYAIDMWIFSHGNRSKITMENNQNLSPSDFEQLSSGKYENKKFPFRMVYQMNCHGSFFIDSFLKAGAKAVCGSRYVNFYPNQCNNFTKRWNDGENFTEAVRNSDNGSSRTVMQNLLVVDSVAKNLPLMCKAMPALILQKNNCAKNYFIDNWLNTSEYDEKKSGKQNMNYSSFMFIRGSMPKIRKTDRPIW